MLSPDPTYSIVWLYTNDDAGDGDKREFHITEDPEHAIAIAGFAPVGMLQWLLPNSYKQNLYGTWGSFLADCAGEQANNCKQTFYGP